MNITKNMTGDALELVVEGRLDTNTSPELEQVINEELGDAKSLRIEMKNLEYVSSAGLRVLMKAQKTMNGKDGMTLANVNDSIKDIFDVTGFLDIFTIVS